MSIRLAFAAWRQFRIVDSGNNPDEEDPTDLEGVLDRLEKSYAHDHNGRITVKDLQDAIGERSFGPLLLAPALVGLSPIGAIPGVPFFTSAIIFLVALQILFGLKHFWLPGTIARRSISTHRLRQSLARMRPIARTVDRFIGPRLTIFTRGPFLYALAFLCLVVSAITPVIEVVPLAGIIPNAALVAVALAITAHDGLWVLVALFFSAASFYLISMAF